MIEMQLKQILLIMAMGSLSAVGLSGQSPAHGKNGISMMFLDAHSPDQPVRYSHSEIKKMIHDAKSPEDFSRLADYFDYQTLEYQQKTQQQVAELERLLALPHHARSYPSQVEVTRDLIKQYRDKAHDCSAQAEAYREQATTGAQ